MRTALFAAAFVAFGGLSSRAVQEDTVVPVHQEPRHRLVFETAGTKILDVQIPPGDTTLFHTHAEPILYVTMSTSRTRSQALGAAWSGEPLTNTITMRSVAESPVVPSQPPGRNYSVTTYAKQPLTHRVNNVGASLFRLIGITNESAGDASAAPSPDFAGQPEVDNPWFRTYRWISTQPVTHRHANPVVLIAVSGRATVEAGTRTPLEEPRPYLFIAADTPHLVSPVGGAANLIEVEIRRR